MRYHATHLVKLAIEFAATGASMQKLDDDKTKLEKMTQPKMSDNAWDRLRKIQNNQDQTVSHVNAMIAITKPDNPNRPTDELCDVVIYANSVMQSAQNGHGVNADKAWKELHRLMNIMDRVRK